MSDIQVDFGQLLASLFELDDVFDVQQTQPQQHSPPIGQSGRTVTTPPPLTYTEQQALPSTPANDFFSSQGSASPPGVPLTNPRQQACRQTTTPSIKQDKLGKRGRKGSGLGSSKQQISELEAQLSKKLAEVQLLESQNLRLKDKARMLEVVVRARDEQVERLKRLRGQLQQLQHPSGADPCSPAGRLRPQSATSLPSTTITSSDTSNGSHGGLQQQPWAPLDDLGQPTRQSYAISGTQGSDPYASIRPASAGGGGNGGAGIGAGGREVTSGHMLQPFDPAVLVAYTRLSVEQLMSNHHDIIAQLTTELIKPKAESRLTEMMSNLREFARCMALLTDKFQLMVSRDVSVVPPCPATLDNARSQSGSTSTPPSASSDSSATAGTWVGTGAKTKVRAHGADAAAIMAASLVPSISGGEASSGELVISDEVTHVGLEGMGGRSREGSGTMVEDLDVEADSEGRRAKRLLLASAELLAHELSPETQAHWSQVVVALCLSAQQQADTRALWDLHQGWMTKLKAERQRLSQALDEVLNRSKYGQVYRGAGAATGMTEAQVVKQLHKNVQAEHALLMLLGEVFQYQILDLEQAAKLLIQSWPFIPDTIGIMHAVLSGAQAP